MRKRCLAEPANNQGILYVAAMPLGNIQDISVRVLETTESVDYILAEDTRSAARIFNHYHKKVKMVSYHEHSSSEKRELIIKDLCSGKRIMLTSEAGTPTISDPGYQLIKQAREAGVEVFPMPGASALIAALSVSGFPSDRFLFVGFLPKKQKKKQALKELMNETTTVILYESPHRVVETIQDIVEVDCQRKIFIAREMTKKHEEYLKGTAETILEEFSMRERVRGEFVLIIEGGQKETEKDKISLVVKQLIAKGISSKDCLDIISNSYGLKRNAVRQIISEYVKM